MAEYITIPSKTRTRRLITHTLLWQTLRKVPKSIDDLPEWNFDGSSTEQAPGDNSDVYMRPVAMYPDPIRGGDNVMVMTECWNADGTPNKYNYRHEAARLMDANAKQKIWFGLEQEYTLLGLNGWPYGWPADGYPGPQGPYYCGVGTGRVYCRDIIEAHYKACLYAGIQISGINAEVMPAQWEFQIGPCEGIERKSGDSEQAVSITKLSVVGDHLWMARFLLHRISEEFGAKVTFAPKPIKGEWNGAGLHANVSTSEMREDGGMKAIEGMMKKLEKRHVEHIKVYGEGNIERMTGKHETAHIDKFTWGVANRGASVRIPRECARNGKGYFEDRRPASNADPYQITGILVETV